MMFATDLDRTIIYSKNALEDLGPPLDDRLLAVEMKDGKELSFMTKIAVDNLKGIAAEVLLVPVTTRTTKQFERVSIFKNEINVKYAVTFNGAEILYNGKQLPDWQGEIKGKLQKNCAGHDELEAFLNKNPLGINGRLKSADGIFLYYLLEAKLSKEQVTGMKRAASAYGWRVSYQGRKLYFMPNPISKGAAIEFIKEREGVNTVIGAGDSLLDEDFLVKCDHSFVPKHGELAESDGLMTHILTEMQGAYAGEEILAKIKEIIS